MLLIARIPPQEASQTTLPAVETPPPHSATQQFSASFHCIIFLLCHFLSLPVECKLHESGHFVCLGHFDSTKYVEYRVSNTDLGFNK